MGFVCGAPTIRGNKRPLMNIYCSPYIFTHFNISHFSRLLASKSLKNQLHRTTLVMKKSFRGDAHPLGSCALFHVYHPVSRKHVIVRGTVLWGFSRRRVKHRWLNLILSQSSPWQIIQCRFFLRDENHSGKSLCQTATD